MTISWMQDLEDRVREASARLHQLRAENETLKQRLRALEDQPAAGREGGEAAWEAEREEIRRRVEDLVAHLEQLLRDAD